VSLEEGGSERLEVRGTTGAPAGDRQYWEGGEPDSIRSNSLRKKRAKEGGKKGTHMFMGEDRTTNHSGIYALQRKEKKQNNFRVYLCTRNIREGQRTLMRRTGYPGRQKSVGIKKKKKANGPKCTCPGRGGEQENSKLHSERRHAYAKG